MLKIPFPQAHSPDLGVLLLAFNSRVQEDAGQGQLSLQKSDITFRASLNQNGAEPGCSELKLGLGWQFRGYELAIWGQRRSWILLILMEGTSPCGNNPGFSEHPLGTQAHL